MPLLRGSAGPMRAWLAWLAGLTAAAILGATIPAVGVWAPLGVVGLVAGVVILWRPYVGFLLVVASLPADVAGVIGGVDAPAVLSVTKLLAAWTLAAEFVAVVLTQRAVRMTRFATPQTFLAAGLIAWSAIAALSGATEESARELVRMGFLFFFVLFAIHFVDSTRRLRQTALVLVLSATAASAHSLVQRGLGATMSSEDWVAQAGAVLDVGEEALGEMLRTTGTFSHPAWLGLFVSLVVPLTLYFAWIADRRRQQAAAVAALLVQALGVYSTFSRMAFVGVALGAGLFVLRRRAGAIGLIAGAALALAAYPLLPEALRARVESIVNYRESSSSLTRIGQQWAGWEMIRAQPLLGVGPGNYESQALAYGVRVPELYPVQAIGAHNMYIEAAAELGVPGLLWLVALIAWSIVESERLRRASRDRREALLWECVGLALIVFAFSATFVHAQDRKEWWLLVALIAAGRSMPSSCAPASAT